MKIKHTLIDYSLHGKHDWYKVSDKVLDVTDLLPDKPAKFWSRFPFDVYCETEEEANVLANFFRTVYQDDDAVTVEYCDEEELNPGDLSAGWWCVSISTKGKNIEVRNVSSDNYSVKWW